MRETLARNLARDADLFVVPVEDYGVARIDRGVLEVGPDASPDVIATLACRRQLQLDGVHDEERVRELVEHVGFVYMPERASLLLSNQSGVAYRAVG